jgi:membrane protease YdiL (CAAX protease family)
MPRLRLRLALELVAIFVALPTVVALGLLDPPKIPFLLGLTAACGLVLLCDPSWDPSELAWRRVRRGALRGVLLRIAVVGPAIVLVAVALLPREELFSLPRRQPLLFLGLVVLYPLLSVLPQEVVWRCFLFHRYRPLLGGGLAIAVASAALFALLHVVYLNVLAPALSVAGGLILARTFARSRSLWVVSLEHALYGLAIFAVGLGRYFDGGAAQ